MAIDTKEITSATIRYTRDEYREAVQWLLANAGEDPFLLNMVQFLANAKFLTPKQVVVILNKMAEGDEDAEFAAQAAALLDK